MRIGIVTQPLFNNYGGVLQNYALQTILKRMGHDPITIDCIPQNSIVRWLVSTVRSLLFFPFRRFRRPFAPFPKPRLRDARFNAFVDRYLVTTPLMYRFPKRLVERFELDAVIVGSDQVWRPKYNPFLTDSFLAFASKTKICRIAYAASFGVDNWEYSLIQTRICRRLAQKFDAISVREESGVNLCKQFLGVNAVHVLDPTFLLSSEDYEQLLDTSRPEHPPYLAAYILDDNEEKRGYIQREADLRGLAVRFFSAGKNASLRIEDWLAIFFDSSFVVTDSFHGTVFSIIFGKEFICLANKERGNARIDSLLRLNNQNRIDALRQTSIRFLSENL